MDTADPETDGLATASTEPNEETIEEIKKQLRLKLKKSGMISMIRRMVQDICASGKSSKVITPNEVISEIYKRGLLSNFLTEVDRGKITSHFADTNEEESNAVKNEDQDKDSSDSGDFHLSELFSCLEALVTNKNDDDEEEETCRDSSSNISISAIDVNTNGKYFLKMEIMGGTAFLDNLFDDKAVYYGKRPNFVLHVFYKSQRFCTPPTDCCCDPDLRDTFMIDVGCIEKGDVSELLSSQHPLRIVLICNDVNSPHSTVISHCLHDWRFFLMSEKYSQRYCIELFGIGSESKVPIGILSVRLTMLPRAPERVSKATYNTQINIEKTRRDESQRALLVYAKQWWKDFHEIRPEHSTRNVKLFSYDECMTSRPVQSFIRPMSVDHILLTPYHAAWFVSLLPVKQNAKTSQFDVMNVSSHPCSKNFAVTSVAGGGEYICVESECWQSLETIIASKAGSVADHCIFLCSLLLGFGLDAYVALGNKAGNASWFWVVTFDGNYIPTFWESTSGTLHKLFNYANFKASTDLQISELENKKWNLETISCLFNNVNLYANIQISNRIEMIEWTINNPAKWKKFSVTSLQFPDELPPSLLKSSKNLLILSSDIEMQLQVLITEARQNVRLKTRWDKKLYTIIGQQLSYYETEASTGAKYSDNIFENSILNYLPNGYDFKGFPMHSNCLNSAKLLSTCMKDPQCQEILYSRGDDVQLAVRVLCFSYPEDVVSVRIMIACKFLCTD